MNELRDGYLVLAICVATAAIVGTVVQGYQFLHDFDRDVFVTLSIVSSAFAQISLALTMVCAVIIGRNMIAARNAAESA